MNYVNNLDKLPDTIIDPVLKSDKVSLIIPFDYSRIEHRFGILATLISGIIDRDDTIIDMYLREIVEDSPNAQVDYQRLYKKVYDSYNDILIVCEAYLFPLFNMRYILIEAVPLGSSLCMTLDILKIDYSVDDYYQHYL